MSAPQAINLVERFDQSREQYRGESQSVVRIPVVYARRYLRTAAGSICINQLVKDDMQLKMSLISHSKIIMRRGRLLLCHGKKNSLDCIRYEHK